MRAVVFARSGCVKQFVVPLHQPVPALRLSPYPFPKSVLDGLLFLLGEHCGFRVQHALFLAVRTLNGIVKPHVAQVERIFQNLIRACPQRAVCFIRRHIISA